MPGGIELPGKNSKRPKPTSKYSRGKKANITLESWHKLLYRSPKPHEGYIDKFWRIFDNFWFFVNSGAYSATPLELRFFLRHPERDNFEFLESSCLVQYSHQISEHLEHFLPLKRSKNTSFFTFLPHFQAWRCAYRSFGNLAFRTGYRSSIRKQRVYLEIILIQLSNKPSWRKFRHWEGHQNLAASGPIFCPGRCCAFRPNWTVLAKSQQKTLIYWKMIFWCFF